MGLRMAMLATMTSLPACVWVGPRNPGMPITRREASQDLQRMAEFPRPLERPVVVLGGWRSPHAVTKMLQTRLRLTTSGREQDFLAISYPLSASIDTIARRVVEKVQERWPSEKDGQTIEVDVVAFSMGGLVARLAAMPVSDEDHRQLKIRRLFTLATPHRGAKLAGAIAPDAASRDMRRGSDFLERLDHALETADYDLLCYAHLNDRMVGARNTSPPGVDPIWVNGTIALSHYTTTLDRRIRADLARRLRGEKPFSLGTSEPPRD